MPQLLLGECLGTKSEDVKPRDGSEGWVQHTVVVLVGYETHFVRVGKDFAGALPTSGERVALEVSSRAYIRSIDGEPAVTHTCYGRVKAAEKVAGLDQGLYLVADVLGVERNGNAVTVIVLDGFATHQVAVSSAWEGLIPDQGETVALHVAPFAFPRGPKAAGYGFSAVTRVDSLASAVAPAATAAAAS